MGTCPGNEMESALPLQELNTATGRVEAKVLASWLESTASWQSEDPSHLLGRSLLDRGVERLLVDLPTCNDSLSVKLRALDFYPFRFFASSGIYRFGFAAKEAVRKRRVPRSERLDFSPFEPEDQGVMGRMLGHPEVMRFYPQVYPPAEWDGWISKQCQRYRTYGYGFWLLRNRQDGAPLGQAGLLPLMEAGYEWPALGYILCRSAWGQGFATEAARACCHWGRDVLGLDRVLCLIRPVNRPSLQVAHRLGFRVRDTVSYAGFEHLLMDWKA
ncbi:MAG: N-acetyltransferase [Planctomycetota bacterium]|nr:MAG: N-acetyltransferase [Planctomycetota bacterium]